MLAAGCAAQEHLPPCPPEGCYSIYRDVVAGQPTLVFVPDTTPSGVLLDASPGWTYRVVLAMHHRGASAQEFAQGGLGWPFTSALLKAGYIVAASDAGGETWGQPQSLAYERALVDHVRQTTHSQGQVSSRIYLLGGSMGGTEALMYAATYPREVAAVALISPVTHPGFPGVGDPQAQAAALAGTPLVIWAGGSDTNAPTGQQSAVLVAAIRGAGGHPELHVQPGEGHLTAGLFHPSEVVAFFQAHP